MEDEFLRSLWQKSGEDKSFLELFDVKESAAKKEVMGHLVKMMSSVRCPKEGESTSNLYRILVKKLKGHISNFGSNPEVVDMATKKIAKWVEGLVKEAYYRKQGLIKPRQEERVQRLEQESVKEVVRKKSREKLSKESKYDKSRSQLTKSQIKNKGPKSVIIDGKEYFLKEKNEEEEEEERKRKQTDIRANKRPAPKEEIKKDDKIGKKVKIDTNAPSISYIENEQVKSVIENPPEKKEPLLIKHRNATNFIVDREVQVSKVLDDELDRVKDLNYPTTRNTAVTASSSLDFGNATPLIRNWSNWMINLTQKAKNLVKWDTSLIMDEFQDSNDIQLTNPPVEIKEEHKWNELVEKNTKLNEGKLNIDKSKNTQVSGPPSLIGKRTTAPSSSYTVGKSSTNNV